jgi:hypothetical protein
VHGDGVAVGDVLAQVGAFEEDMGAVIEAFSGQTVRRRVNCNDAPAVAVAHRIERSGPVGRIEDADSDVVAAADDRVADADAVSPRACDG